MRLKFSVIALMLLFGWVSPSHAHNLLDGSTAERLPALLTAALLFGGWLIYLIGTRRCPPNPRNQLLFHGTTVLAVLTLLGPFDEWAKTGTAWHMVQHMLLMVVLPPLWIFARPLPQIRAGLTQRMRLLWTVPLKAAQFPMAMALLHGSMIWFWHAPVPYMVAVENPWWHAVEHACFVVTAGLFWWSVLHASQANLGRALAALLVTLMHTGLLGALLTFANTPVYDESSSLQDQQLAGLIMWVPGGIVYLLAGAWCSRRWLRLLVRNA